MDKHRALVVSNVRTLATDLAKGKLIKYVPNKVIKFNFEVNERKESERA